MVRAIRTELPAFPLYYLADSAYCPYGPRPAAEVRERSLHCARLLVAEGARVVVVACNTATSAALELLRAELPVPVIGMEPGVKPASAATRNGRIGILATDGTLAGTRYASLVQRFAAHIHVTGVACPGLVEQVEAGDLGGPATRALLARYLAPLRAAAVDTIVLGCTHYPFLSPLIAAMVEPHVSIIDTGPAVARQVARVVAQHAIPATGAALRIATTGDPVQVAPVVTRLLGEWVEVGVRR